MSLLMGIGVSTQADVYEAGIEAAQQMQTHLGAKPQLTLVFSSIRFAHPKLLSAIRHVTEGVPLIGCTDAGGITTWGSMRHSVVVIGLRGTQAGFATGVAHGISQDPEAAGHRLAQDLKASEPGLIRAALMFPDGLAGNGTALLRGVQAGLGTGVPIVGGSAGDDYYFQRTFQYFDDDILTNSVPGAVLYGEVSVGIGVRHGWSPVGLPHQVTRAENNHIFELDGKPAATFYERYLGAHRRRAEDLPLAEASMLYPLGWGSDKTPCRLLRSTIRLGDKKSLVCTGEIPEGSWVHLMMSEPESALTAAAEAAQEAVAVVGQSRFKGALVFSSGGRQKMLGHESQGEVDVIRDSLGGVGVRLGGFYGYGEQAPVSNANLFHNESVVVMALG